MPDLVRLMQLPDPTPALPAGTGSNKVGLGVAWAGPSGDYIAVTINEVTAPSGQNTGGLYVYKRNGDRLDQQLTIPHPYPPTKVIGRCAWSPDGVYLATNIDYIVSGSVRLWRRDGDTLTWLSDTNSGGGTGGDGAAGSSGLDWSPDGVYLAAINADDSTRHEMFKRTGNSLSYLSSINTPFSNRELGEWSPDGNYLATVDKFIKWSSETLTELYVPATFPNLSAFRLSWTYDSLRFSSHAGSTVKTWERTGDALSNAIVSSLPTVPNVRFVRYWPPNDEYLTAASVTGSSNVWTLRILKRVGSVVSDAGRATGMRYGAGNLGSARWTADGKYLAIQASNSTNQLQWWTLGGWSVGRIAIG